MEVKILAICDTQKQYAIRLMEAFCEKKNFGFQIHAFSDVKELQQFAERVEIEILLITGSYMSRALENLKIGKIILLSDGSMSEGFSEYESIYKYQPADRILKAVLGSYAEYAKPLYGMYSGKNEFEVYGVYSPIGRCGKSALAECLAKKFGKQKRTLLLDLQSFSAGKEQLEEEELWDLEDIIYFLRQGKTTFLYKLGSIVRSKTTFDYILPMKKTSDLQSVALAEWTELLEKLASDSDYRVVIIDFGQTVCGLFQLLSQCTKVYAPVLSDAVSRNKMENFEWNLKETNFEKVIESLQKIYIPECVDRMDVKAFMEEWTERSVIV